MQGTLHEADDCLQGPTADGPSTSAPALRSSATPRTPHSPHLLHLPRLPQYQACFSGRFKQPSSALEKHLLSFLTVLYCLHALFVEAIIEAFTECNLDEQKMLRCNFQGGEGIQRILDIRDEGMGVYGATDYWYAN